MTAPPASRGRRRRRPSPETLTLRYLAWCEAKATDFQVTQAELAEALDVPPAELGRAIKGERWAAQLQTGPASLDDAEAVRHHIKGFLP